MPADRVADKIVDASAYLLFYRRRSEAPLGGPRFEEILERFQDDSSDNESGEVQRLGGASSLDGSSSAYPGAGATHQGGSLGGSGTTNGKTNEALSTNLKYDGKAKGVHQSIEDEGVDMGEDHTQPTGFPNNTWNFDKISGAADFEDGAQFSSNASIASDEAQHDSSGDERAHSQTIGFDDGDASFPGVSSYQSVPGPSPEPESAPPTYNEQAEPQVKFLGTMGGKVYEVPSAHADDERKSEEATEIHLDDNDKLN